VGDSEYRIQRYIAPKRFTGLHIRRKNKYRYTQDWVGRSVLNRPETGVTAPSPCGGKVEDGEEEENCK
jgi:hypothetical protein